MTDEHDKVKVIVEEVVQRVYLLDPDSEESAKIIGSLRGIVTGQVVESIPMFHDKNPPTVLGHRAKKGAIPPGFMNKYPPVAEWRRMTAVTTVIPDETGQPSLETKFTPTTASQKPVKK